MVLSPAAQAVLDAANRASSYGPDDCLNDSRFIAAAALRAAADQVVPTEKDRKEQSDITGQVFLNGMQYAVMEIRALAAELDPTP
jgi:hypothetical protein